MWTLQIEGHRASLEAALAKATAHEKRVQEQEKACRLAEETNVSLRNKLDSAEFARARLEREIMSHKAQLAKNQDEASRVLQQQLDENNGRILDLEARLAAAGKEARQFQHRVVDAEKEARASAEALKEEAARATALQQRLEDASSERNAFSDTVRL